MSTDKRPDMPLGEDQALEAVEFGLQASPADATEVLVLAENTDLTRFANLAIHQNVTETQYQIYFRTVWDGRLVVVKGNDLSEEAVKKALLRSEELAATVTPSAALPDFAYPVGSAATDGRQGVVTFNPATANCGAEERAQIVDRVCSVFRSCGVGGAGNVRVRLLEMAVGNSAGLRRYAPFSIIALVAVALDAANNSSGYNTWIGRDIEAMDAESLARQAAVKCLMGRRPKLIEARPMTAILEPPAVAQLFFHLNFRSLGVWGAQSASNRDNIVYDNLGERITASDISVYDEMMTDGLAPMPFDYEGVDKQRLDLIVNGVAKGIAHDLTSAAKFGHAPTGHAQMPGNEFGPSPQHLVIEGGDSSVSDLIESTEYGVLVSRIHGFVSPLSGKEGHMAGTTRDGLFLVENGRVSGPIRNFRWMDRMFSAFETVEGISRERKVQFTDELWFPTCVVAPTIKLGRFNFIDVQRWTEERSP